MIRNLVIKHGIKNLLAYFTIQTYFYILQVKLISATPPILLNGLILSYTLYYIRQNFNWPRLW